MNNTNTNTNNKTNILPEFKTSYVFYASIMFILFLIVMLFLIIFKVKDITKPSKSDKEIMNNVFTILFFTLIVAGICITLIPNLNAFKSLFLQISNVTYIIVYTILFILFFSMTSDDILNKYAYIITPATILLGSFIFYKSASNNYIMNFNVNYERIKTMILLFCLIAIFIVYYNVDPGGYIQKYFGYSMLITIVIAVFAFLYLMIILTLPDKSTLSSKSTNFLNNFTSFSVYGSIGFLLFLIVITIVFSSYPGGFFKNKSTSGASIILLLVICILWGTMLGANLLPETFNSSPANNTMSIFKRSLLVLFGIIISSLIIFWIVYNIQNLSGNSSIVSLVLNLLIVILVLGLIYKTIIVKIPSNNGTANARKNAFFTMIINTLFYIPCIFTSLFDSVGNLAAGESKESSTGSIIMLVVTILLMGVYFTTPSLINKINLQGGKPLVNKPVYTNALYSLGTYQELNGSDNYDYQYAISFWLFLDAAAPNTNASYSKYTSLLNFGDKPNVLYNGKNNTLMVTMQQKDLDKSANKLTDFDENGNRILYKNENVLLQKWNNIIINYNGGIMDIFLNGELVKSDIGVVPYYTLDNLTIGEDDGIQGGICNVVYFKRALTTSNMYYLYNMVKNKSPPVLNESNDTILHRDIALVVSSSEPAIAKISSS
jgi:hypothetical protein